MRLALVQVTRALCMHLTSNTVDEGVAHWTK